MELYFKKKEEDSLIMMIIEKDKRIVYEEYDIECGSDLEYRKKEEIKNGEDYDTDDAECYDKTLEE